jgi:hypothetical protein
MTCGTDSRAADLEREGSRCRRLRVAAGGLWHFVNPRLSGTAKHHLTTNSVRRRVVAGSCPVPVAAADQRYVGFLRAVPEI